MKTSSDQTADTPLPYTRTEVRYRSRRWTERLPESGLTPRDDSWSSAAGVSVALAKTPAFAAVQYLGRLAAGRARLHTASDPVFRTINVLAWDHEHRHG